ncbi:MAG TPA: cell division FtsA domain-containing protein, partial [Candidatus Saccharimonadales bacterium]|nr:cell division FtsA domain-containing protein [Candidatus Saccharimonadales bacterium]
MLRKIKSLKDSAAAKKRQSNASQYIVALDVGTENVKALIGRINEDNVQIVGVGRAHQKLTDMQAGAVADIGSVVENCNRALAIAEEQAQISVRTAVVGIAGELVKGTTTTIRCTRKDPNLELDVAEMEHIIELVQERAEKQARKNLEWELGSQHIDVRLVNSALVSISIDGYNVTNPIGFKGRDILVQLYTAFAPMIHIAALERVTGELDLDLLAVAAEPFAVARSVIGDNNNASMNAILMDVGGGTTDIAIINEGGVQGTKMFGIGGRAYTRSIERDLGVEFDVAEKLKLDFSERAEEDLNQHASISESLDKTCDVWLSGVELALSDYNQLENLPHQILLCGGGASLGKLIDALEQTNWYGQLPFTRKPKVSLIHPEQVVGIEDNTGKANDHTFIT